jgi:hypothetical protein
MRRRAGQCASYGLAADAGGIPPEGGIEAAYKRQLADKPLILRRYALRSMRGSRARKSIGLLTASRWKR